MCKDDQNRDNTAVIRKPRILARRVVQKMPRNPPSCVEVTVFFKFKYR